MGWILQITSAGSPPYVDSSFITSVVGKLINSLNAEIIERKDLLIDT